MHFSTKNYLKSNDYHQLGFWRLLALLFSNPAHVNRLLWKIHNLRFDWKQVLNIISFEIDSIKFIDLIRLIYVLIDLIRVNTNNFFLKLDKYNKSKLINNHELTHVFV